MLLDAGVLLPTEAAIVGAAPRNGVTVGVGSRRIADNATPPPAATSACNERPSTLTIELHAFDTPNGRKISVALEEMGLPYRVHVVDITRREQFAPEFLKISPNNKIPAIVDPDGPDGRPISVFESGAILVYLAEKTGRFWPSEPRARVATMEWLMFQMGGFGPIPGQVHHFIALEDENDRRYALQRYMDETRRLYAVMNARLAGHAFFAGDGGTG